MSKSKNIEPGEVATIPISKKTNEITISIPKNLAKKLGITNKSTTVFAAMTDNVLQISNHQPHVTIPMFVEDMDSFMPQ